MKSHRTPAFATALLDAAKDPGVRAALEKGLGRVPVAAVEGKAAKVSIRVHKHRKIPLTEIQYGGRLKVEFPRLRLEHETWSIRLPGWIKYTPDFTLWDGNRLALIVEVKGPVRLQSSARSYAAFKIAIEGYPEIRFRFAEKQDSGEWVTQDYNTPATEKDPIISAKNPDSSTAQCAASHLCTTPDPEPNL